MLNIVMFNITADSSSEKALKPLDSKMKFEN